MIHVKHAIWTSFGVVLLSAAANAATVSSDDLSRCASIASPGTRLACYDALAHRAPEVVPSAAASLSATPASVAPPAPVAAARPSDDPKSFGLSAVQRHVAVVGPKEESGLIVSLTANQTGHSIIVLDSGQTWTVLDDDGFVSNGDHVTIKRAALGSYLMTTPSHHIYRVHRVQ
jgi:hypothetical protein